MIENDDMSTQPQPVSGDVAAAAATIQIPAATAPTPAASAPAANAIPQTNPYMSVDDLLALRILSGPRLSPDGSQIAFSAQQSDGGQNSASSAIWVVNAKGGKGETPRQLTNLENTTHDIMPCWSPDGQTLAFLSDRSGSFQIHLLPLRGGEARQVSRLSQGVSEYSWRPDGAALLAHSPWKAADEQQQPDTSATAVVYTRLDEQSDGIGFSNGRRQQLWLLPLVWRSRAPHSGAGRYRLLVLVVRRDRNCFLRQSPTRSRPQREYGVVGAKRGKRPDAPPESRNGPGSDARLVARRAKYRLLLLRGSNRGQQHFPLDRRCARAERAATGSIKHPGIDLSGIDG